MAIVAPGIAGVRYGFAGPESGFFAVAGISALAVVFPTRLPRFLPDVRTVKTYVFKAIWEALK